MANRTARREAARMRAAELLANPRENIHHPRKPFGGGRPKRCPRRHHPGLDITVRLGLNWRVPPGRMAIVLDGWRHPTYG